MPETVSSGERYKSVLPVQTFVMTMTIHKSAILCNYKLKNVFMEEKRATKAE